MKKLLLFVLCFTLCITTAHAKDAIQIVITRGCNADGTGGDVADTAKAILPDGQLDLLLDAFESAYGLYKYQDQNGDTVTVSPERSYVVRLRKFSEEVLASYLIDQQRRNAEDQAKTAVDQQLGQISVV